MAMLSAGSKIQFKISPCTVDVSGKMTVDTGTVFESMLNPSSYSHARSIAYNKKKVLGQMGSDTKFCGIEPEKVNFDFLIDGTGVVKQLNAGNEPLDVKTQVKQLTDVVYTYDGNNHEPNHVRILWGRLIFFGRLESMSLEYTLFKPNGVPLRAKVKLAFAGFMSKEEEALRANKSSPDLSHLIEVRAGDTLPMLCYRVYKDSSYYLEIAEINNLSNFRELKPGSKLHFPPLR